MIKHGKTWLDSKAFIQALTHTSSNVRETAATALGKIKDPRAVTPLTKVLLRDRNPAVRLAAVKALGEIGDIRAVLPLTEALDDSVDDVRDEAKNALKRINDFRP